MRPDLRRAAAVVIDDWPESLEPMPAFDCEAYAVDSSCIVPPSLIPGRAYAARSIRPKIHASSALPEACSLRCGTARATGAGDPAAGHSGSRANPGGAGKHSGVLRRVSSTSASRGTPPRRTSPPRMRRPSSARTFTSGTSPRSKSRSPSASTRPEHRLIADEFLEELIVRRELAFNFVRNARKVDSLDELPDWARATLDEHRADPRDPVYTPRQFEDAATYDNLWNATQQELVRRGRIHGYYRMYWGKKILEWSRSPEEALATMIDLHDRYALDARDPNTYTNILWCFGLHDRPWPRRAIYGTVRSMSRAGMERKTDVDAYIREIEAIQ